MKNDINMRKTWKLGYKIYNKIDDFFSLPKPRMQNNNIDSAYYY